MSNPVEFKENESIMIRLNGKTNGSSVVSEVIHLNVVKVTDKAVCFTSDEIKSEKTIWLPKSAIEMIETPKGVTFYDTIYKLKKWFKPNQYQQWFFTKFSKISAI